MVLSDRTIARLLAEGRIEIDPYDDSLLQPSSVDVRVDRYFRVFQNNRYPYIDVREEQEDLTELVEVEDETAFVLHPGEFVLGSTLERVRLPDDLVARLERTRHARAVERRESAGHDLCGHEDRPDLLRPADRAGGDALRDRRDRLQVPGPAGPDAVAVLAELSARARGMIFVTGGSGFVGGHVVHELRGRALAVRCLVRDPGKAGKLAAWG